MRISTANWPCRKNYPAGTRTHNLLITIPALYHWAIPPPHSAKSTGGSRLQLNKDTPSVTPTTQQSQNGLTMLSRHSVGTHQGNKLTYSSPGNTGPQSPQFAEPLWTDPWPERVELQRTSWSPLKKKKKKVQVEWSMKDLPSHTGKKPQPPLPCIMWHAWLRLMQVSLSVSVSDIVMFL